MPAKSQSIIGFIGLNILLCAPSDVVWKDHLTRARTLFENGLYGQSETEFTAALQVADQFGADDPRLAKTLNNSAVLENALGRRSLAEKRILQAIAIWEKEAPGRPDAPLDLPTAWSNLGEVYLATARISESKALVERAITAYEKIGGASDPHLGPLLGNLGVINLMEHRFEEANRLLERSLAIRRSSGGDPGSVAKGSNILGELRLGQGRFVEAEALFHEALNLTEHSRGPEHPDLVLVLNNLAELYIQQARPQDAEPLLQRCLRILRRAGLPPNSPHLAVELTGNGHETSPRRAAGKLRRYFARL